MTPAERSYSRAVEVANRLLGLGLPVIGLAGTPDGVNIHIRVLVGNEVQAFTLPVETNFMSAEAYVRAAMRGEEVAG